LSKTRLYSGIVIGDLLHRILTLVIHLVGATGVLMTFLAEGVVSSALIGNIVQDKVRAKKELEIYKHEVINR